MPLEEIWLSYLPTSILSGFIPQRSKEIENMREVKKHRHRDQSRQLVSYTTDSSLKKKRGEPKQFKDNAENVLELMNDTNVLISGVKQDKSITRNIC